MTLILRYVVYGYLHFARSQQEIIIGEKESPATINPTERRTLKTNSCLVELKKAILFLTNL